MDDVRRDRITPAGIDRVVRCITLEVGLELEVDISMSVLGVFDLRFMSVRGWWVVSGMEEWQGGDREVVSKWELGYGMREGNVVVLC